MEEQLVHAGIEVEGPAVLRKVEGGAIGRFPVGRGVLTGDAGVAAGHDAHQRRGVDRLDLPLGLAVGQGDDVVDVGDILVVQPVPRGVDALAVMRRLGTRMKLWHINDRGTRVKPGPVMTPILKSDSMELGYGNMNLTALAEQAKSAGIDAVILESHKNWAEKSPLKSLQLSARFLQEHF